MSTSQTTSRNTSRHTSPLTSPTTSQTSSRSSSPKNKGTATPNVQRRAAKRRQAIGARLRIFEATLPGFGAGKGFEGMSRSASSSASRAAAHTASQLGFSGFVWSKLASLAALLAVITTLVWMQIDPVWYVYPERTAISGQRLVDPTALYTTADIEGWNIFWLQRDVIRDRLLQHPWVTAATVSLRAPADVVLEVTEAPVVGVWATEAGSYWISPQGAALPLAGETPPSMPRLIDIHSEAAVPGSAAGTAVDTGIVASALALISQMPGLIEVRYSEVFGLNFGLPGTNLWVYWGNGEQVQAKMEAIALARQLVASGELQTSILDVRIPERTFVK